MTSRLNVRADSGVKGAPTSLAADNIGTRSVGEPRELLEMLGGPVSCVAPLAGRSDEERPLGRRCKVNQFS